MRVLPLGLLTAAALAGPMPGQGTERLEARVTTVTNGSVYLDKGRADGVEPGDGVTLYLPAGQVQTRISAVSRSSSRAEVPAGTTISAPGLRAEILRTGRAGAAAPSQTPAPSEPTAPQHPPWENPENGFNPDQPLLAPAFGQGAAARPTRLFGRVFANYTGTWDGGFDERQYSLGILGTDLTVENPAHLGGRLRFRGSLTGRLAHLDDVPDVASERGRIDRLSYAWGDEQDAPVRVEVGRFLQAQVPELGLIDGVETLLPLGSSGTVGISFGALLEPFPARATGDDLQTALSYHFAAGEDDIWFETTVALQKTWHKGAPDRDLLFGDLTVRPLDDLSIYSSIWIDYYTSSDTVKSKGLEVTEYHLQTSYRINENNGVGLNFSHIRWPELKRREFTSLPPDDLRDSRLDRLGLNTWHELLDGVRLDLRLDHFDDQDGNGTSGEARVGLRDLLYEQGEVSVSLFRNEASFTTGEGVRLYANRYLGFGYGGVRYEISQYDNNDLSGSDTLTLQAVGGNLDFDLSAQTSASINVDYLFGDAQQAFTLSAFAQTRF